MKSLWIMPIFLLVVATSCAPHPTISEDGSVKTTYIHQYGMEVAGVQEWNERGASGQIIKQLKDGSSQSQCWQEGKLHGLATLSFPHSHHIYQETYYDKGAKVWQTVNYPSGMPKRQDIYRPGNVQMVSTWYEDGAPRSSEEYHADNLWNGEYFSRNQELETQVVQGNGERIRRDGHGQLLAKDEVENGKKILEVVFYSNGMPQKYIPYVNDRIQGTLKTFYAGGEPATIEAWKNDVQEGDTILFRSGERVAIVPYVDGQKQGIEKRFRPGSDIVTEEISWKDNLKHGPCLLFVDDGKVTEYFFEGQKVTRGDFTHREANTKP